MSTISVGKSGVHCNSLRHNIKCSLCYMCHFFSDLFFSSMEMDSKVFSKHHNHVRFGSYDAACTTDMNVSIRKAHDPHIIDQHSTIVIKRNVLIDYIYRSFYKISSLSYSFSFLVDMIIPFEDLCEVWIVYHFCLPLKIMIYSEV